MNAHNASPDTAAAVWMARRDAGWSATDQAEFQAWFDASPENTLAWAKVDAAWHVLDLPRHDGLAQSFALQLAVRQRRRRMRRSAFACIALATAAGLALMLVAPVGQLEPAPVTAAPQLVRSLQQVLPDGSVVDLNRNAEIVVEYTSARRTVRLVRGEAHFDVKSQVARPFVVRAGGVDVRAVGTAFAVRLDADAVDVLVTKGSVEVEAPAETASASGLPPVATVMISAGDCVSMPMAAVKALPATESVSAAEIARRLQWRGPRLELSGTKLADAIATLNKTSRVQVTIADAGLAQLRMSGVFRADDLEGFVDVLATNYGAVVERNGNEIVLRRREKR
jgi:transmembrane sensor